MTTTQGLTSKELVRYSELLTKANTDQLRAMYCQLVTEVKAREKIIKHVLGCARG